jgi:hypothetical protein
MQFWPFYHILPNATVGSRQQAVIIKKLLQTEILEHATRNYYEPGTEQLEQENLTLTISEKQAPINHRKTG